MELTGKLKVKRDTLVVSEKFQKREFVLTDESSQYPQDILFQLSQDKVTLIDKVNEGEVITAHFNLRGREWTNPQGEVKYFNTLDVWRVESSEIGSPAPQSTKVEEEGDGMPF
jgi:hypothetical protein